MNLFKDGSMTILRKLPLPVLLGLLLLTGCSSSPQTQQSRAADVGFYAGMAALESLAGAQTCTGCREAMSAGNRSATTVYKEGSNNPPPPTIIIVKR